MSKLIIEDLMVSRELDRIALTRVRGGLNANIANTQAGNQGFAGLAGLTGIGGVGGYGAPMFALNMPINIPTTVLTEVNPNINVNLDLANLMGSSQNLLT